MHCGQVPCSWHSEAAEHMTAMLFGVISTVQGGQGVPACSATDSCTACSQKQGNKAGLHAQAHGGEQAGLRFCRLAGQGRAGAMAAWLSQAAWQHAMSASAQRPTTLHAAPAAAAASDPAPEAWAADWAAAKQPWPPGDEEHLACMGGGGNTECRLGRAMKLNKARGRAYVWQANSPSSAAAHANARTHH